MIQLRGLGTALITPFTQSGDVDYPALERLLDRQLAGNADYLVVLGTTGEAATMTGEEKAQVCRYIINKVRGKLPLVLGLGGNCTATVIKDLEQMHDELLAHFAAILSVCPYYNKPNQEGLFQHFTAIAKVSPVPVILYNVPGRTGVNLLPETVIRIKRACPDQIMGIKEASGKLEQIKRLIEMAKGEGLLVISGDDSLAVEVMKAGGAGLISVASNAWPKQMGQMIRQMDEAMQLRYGKIIKYLFEEGNPGGIKTVLNKMGMIENMLRLPLVPNSPILQGQIEKEIASLE